MIEKLIQLLSKYPDIIGRTVYLLEHKRENKRCEAEILEVHIQENSIWFEWAQYDRGYELTEVWDEGDFDLEDIGKTVFFDYEEMEKAEQAMEGEV